MKDIVTLRANLKAKTAETPAAPPEVSLPKGQTDYLQGVEARMLVSNEIKKLGGRTWFPGCSHERSKRMSFFKDVDSINITGGFFNASQPQHN